MHADFAFEVASSSPRGKEEANNNNARARFSRVDASSGKSSTHFLNSLAAESKLFINKCASPKSVRTTRSTTAYFFVFDDVAKTAASLLIATSAFSPYATHSFALCSHLTVAPRMADPDASNTKHLASPIRIGTRTPPLSLLPVEEALRKMSCAILYDNSARSRFPSCNEMLPATVAAYKASLRLASATGSRCLYNVTAFSNASTAADFLSNFR
mmetsp:Transcript_5302/g.18043  ORF Transcript_5302/g.18043 Transcript_5302/m.18043 type:complete len:214 (+) Transcript_5302:1615-2256(+)